MKKFIKKFKEAWNKDIVRELDQYREFLWYSRLFFVGIATERALNTIHLFLAGVVTFDILIIVITICLLISLSPYAYGIDADIKKAKEKKDEVHF